MWCGEQPWTSCWKASSSQSPGQHCPEGDQLSAARERTLPEQGPCGGHVLFGLSVTWTGRILGAEPVWPEPPLRATPPPRGGHPAPLTRPRGPRLAPKAAPVIYLRLNPAHAPQASTHPDPVLDPALGCRATHSPRQQRTGWTCGQGRQLLLRHVPLSLAHPTTASASRMWKLRHRAAQSAPKDTRLVPGRAGVWTGPRCSSSSFCRCQAPLSGCPEGCLVQSGQVGSSREAHGADLGAEPSHRLGRPA